MVNRTNVHTLAKKISSSAEMPKTTIASSRKKLAENYEKIVKSIY